MALLPILQTCSNDERNLFIFFYLFNLIYPRYPFRYSIQERKTYYNKNFLRLLSITGCPRKNATDLNNSNGSCFILISKQLFLLKSTTIRINFDIFSSIIGNLVIKLKISKAQNCFQVKTRAAALAIVD